MHAYRFHKTNQDQIKGLGLKLYSLYIYIIYVTAN